MGFFPGLGVIGDPIVYKLKGDIPCNYWAGCGLFCKVRDYGC